MGTLFNESGFFRGCLVVTLASAYFLLQSPPEKSILDRALDPGMEEAIDVGKVLKGGKDLLDDILK